MTSVLITGAAGGIGRKTVARFARLGWTVFATDREAADFGGWPNVHSLALDVTSEASALAARERIAELLDGAPLDVLVNNAGIGRMGPIAQMRDEDARAMFEVNALGPLRLTRVFGPLLAAHGRGRVVNVGSLAGIVTLPFLGAYCASKHAVEALSDAMRLELAAQGIAVSLVQPAIVNTGFVVEAIASLRGYADAGPWQAGLARTGALRSSLKWSELDPDQVARTVVRAATARWPRARYPVGRLSALLIALLKWIPTFVADAGLRLALAVGPPVPVTLPAGESPPGRSVVS